MSSPQPELKRTVFFTMEFYLDEEQEIRAAFDYDGQVLQAIENNDLAYTCFDRAVRVRALIDAAFTDAEELLANMEQTSPKFSMKGEGD